MQLYNEEEAIDQLIQILEDHPKEAKLVLQALEDGRVDGGFYYSTCCCLFGILGKALEVDPSELARGYSGGWPLTKVEKLFFYIHKGDTPDTSKHARLVYDTIYGWLDKNGLLK